MSEVVQGGAWNDFKRSIVGLWIVFLYVSFVCVVILTLSVYHFQRELEDTYLDEIETRDSSIFKKHLCEVSELSEYDFASTMVYLPCVPNTSEETGEEPKKGANLRQRLESEIERFQFDYDRAQTEIKKLKAQQGKANSEIAEGFLLENLKRAEFIEAEAEKNRDEAELKFKIFERVHQDGKFYNSFFALIINGLRNVQSLWSVSAGPVGSGEGSAAEADVTNIWDVPTIFISIVLVLSMGGLGSLITVTIEFLSDDDMQHTQVAKYFLRPLLGSVVGLASYVAVKSGHVTLAGESVNELSPFLLSLIGIVAGIMSEHVYRRLVDYGEKII